MRSLHVCTGTAEIVPHSPSRAAAYAKEPQLSSLAATRERRRCPAQLAAVIDSSPTGVVYALRMRQVVPPGPVPAAHRTTAGARTMQPAQDQRRGAMTTESERRRGRRVV